MPSSGEILELEPSRIDRCVRRLWWLALISAPLLIYRDGYPLLAVAVAGYELLCLRYRCGSQPAALGWRAGRWYLLWPGRPWSEVELVAPARCLPWLVYLRWRYPGQHRVRLLCLWPDNASAREQRRLRKQLLICGS